MSKYPFQSQIATEEIGKARRQRMIDSGLMVHESYRRFQYFVIVGMPGGSPRLRMMAFSVSEKCESY